jgi:hypothetical protein
LKFPKAGAAQHGSAEGDANGSADGAKLSAAELFALLWHNLADVLGTAAAATLLRRAAQRAVVAFPELSALEITREGLEYEYKVPGVWNEPSDPPQALRGLVRELWGFLVELTGSVVVGRLSQVPELRASGLVPEKGQQL